MGSAATPPPLSPATAADTAPSPAIWPTATITPMFPTAPLGPVGALGGMGVVCPCSETRTRRALSVAVELRGKRIADACCDVQYPPGTRLVVELPGGAPDVATVLGPGGVGTGRDADRKGYDTSLICRGLRVVRVVAADEAESWDTNLDEDELIALEYLRGRQAVHKVPITIVRAVATYDRRCLAVHYRRCSADDVRESDEFRALVRDAGMRFCCRVRTVECEGDEACGETSA